MSSEDEEESVSFEPETKPQCLRLIEATSNFGIILDEYCDEKNLLIAESLRFDDVYNFLNELLDN